MRKKYKTTDLAYSKIKNQIESLKKQKIEMEESYELIKKQNEGLKKQRMREKEEMEGNGQVIIQHKRESFGQKKVRKTDEPLIDMLEKL